MSGSTFVWVRENPEQDTATISGRGSIGAVLHHAGLYRAARRTDRGFNIPLALVADLVAFCESQKISVRMRAKS